MIEGSWESDHGVLEDHVRKDDRAKRMRVVGKTADDAKLARLRYMTLARSEHSTLLAVKLDTGRKHQIRLQFSDRGHAVVGDRKYKAATSFPNGIALHSWTLGIQHPTQKIRIGFRVDPPESWKSRWKKVTSSGDLLRRVMRHFEIPSFDEIP